MKVKIQQVLPQGFDNIKPHSWECELYKEDKNGQILVPIDAKNCREKLLKDMKIGDFVAVRLDEKSGKTGTIAGQIVELIPKKIEVNKGQIAWQAMQNDFKQVFVEKFNKLESEISRLKDELAKAKQEVDKKVCQGQRNLSLAFNNSMCENTRLKDKLTRLEKIPAVKDLLEFETRLNSLWIARCKANDELLAFAAELDNLGYTFKWSDKDEKQFEIHKKGVSDDN